jgi:hypothetical protein
MSNDNEGNIRTRAFLSGLLDTAESQLRVLKLQHCAAQNLAFHEEIVQALSENIRAQKLAVSRIKQQITAIDDEIEAIEEPYGNVIADDWVEVGEFSD